MEIKTLEQVKNEHIVFVLNETKGNKAKTARLLGIAVKSLYNAIERMGNDLKFSYKTFKYFLKKEISVQENAIVEKSMEREIKDNRTVDEICNDLYEKGNKSEN